jgi:hypothetical protein
VDATARLGELMERYDGRAETNTLALVQEMERLGGLERAAGLASSPDPRTRRLAARLMHVLSDDRHVEPLGQLVADDDPEVAATAHAALHVQVRTPRWRALVERLAAEGDPQAAAWLEER